jgi:DNA mismatch repair protein MSH4
MLTNLAQILSQRDGVVNMHLVVDMNEDTMTMLYKIGEGYVKEEHYGLALARVVDLPPKVLEVAESVSKALEEQIAAKKKSSKSFAHANRRKLVLNLKETLEALAKGPMTDKPLHSFLKKLQEEFVIRMEAIEDGITSSETEDARDAAVIEDSGEEPVRELDGTQF